MDALRSAIENVSLYDVKAAVRKAQNVVMNYTEMEAKVREATNNEPWGASSTLMNEIASGTYNYQLLNEIMPMIYKRFTEKSAEEWRQIYKALQLLEFLIRNGSEQVIDDARSHLSTIKMLRQFYFIDLAGKDQGINVRNRAKELTDLLSDVDRIRQERKKARQNRNKYSGVEGGGGLGGNPFGGASSGNGFGRRYGGFGSETGGGAPGAGDFGGYSGGVYGDGGGFSGASRTTDFHDSSDRSRSASRNQFEEYDEGDDGAASRTPQRRHPSASAASSKPPPPKKAAPPKPAEPEPDLLGGFDDPAPASAASNGKGKATASSALDDFGAMTSGGADDDDFDDFQSATPAAVATSAFQPPPAMTSSASPVNLMQPAPLSTQQHNDIHTLVGMTSPTTSAASTPGVQHGQGMGSVSSLSSLNMGGTPAGGMSTMGGMRPMQASNTGGYTPVQPNYFTSVPSSGAPSNQIISPLSPTATGGSAKSASQPKKAGNDAFGNIWNTASSGVRKSATPVNSTPTASLQAMAKEKASAGIWGTGSAAGNRASTGMNMGMGMGGMAGSQSTPPAMTQKTGGDLDDLLG